MHGDGSSRAVYRIAIYYFVAYFAGLRHVTDMCIYGRARTAREEAFCEPSLCSVRRRWLARRVDAAIERLSRLLQ